MMTPAEHIAQCYEHLGGQREPCARFWDASTYDEKQVMAQYAGVDHFVACNMAAKDWDQLSTEQVIHARTGVRRLKAWCQRLAPRIRNEQRPVT